jgi:23S rRNA (adenine2030-N6)-methyltransferase
MLSYRHAFHAGNYADVLKHTVLIHALDYLLQKDKSLRIIDTHAGAGLYKLNSAQALKTNEFSDGIGKLWALEQAGEEIPTPLATYLKLVKSVNPPHMLNRYPGSPTITQALMRTQDRLIAHELHPADAQVLKEHLGEDKRIKIVDDDGFAGMQALLPPPDRRALVLIDPSYEVKSDYQLVVKELIQAHKRFATGTYAIWYPVVLRQRITEMEQALKKSGIKNIQLYELAIRADNPEYGMTASGMILVNPPWALWKTMEETLPWLVDHLGGEGAKYRLEQLVSE